MIPTSRFVSSIYCDDVRFEVGNKVSYTGVYVSGMEIQRHGGSMEPVTLAKLCVVMTAQTPINDPFETLKFRLLRDGDLLQEMEVPQSTLALARDKFEADSMFYVFGAVLTLQSFQITKSEQLRATIVTEREELMSPALRINLVGAEPAKVV